MSVFIIVLLVVIIIVLTVRLILSKREINDIIDQMDDIKGRPDTNIRLRADYLDRMLEKLTQKINELYMLKQQERIRYQRREKKIRAEIENISHDLRTPLTSIIGYVTLLKEDELTEEEKKEYLDIIYKRAKILQGYIGDFYDLSRVEAGDYITILEDLNVQTMISENMLAYVNEFEAKGIDVQINLSNQPFYLIADRTQFTRILNNIIQNALKYSQSIFIITMKSTEDQCEIVFENDNPMMTNEIVENVFDRFFTGDRSRNTSNTGLGLSIAKLLIEKMGGLIQAKLVDDHFQILLKLNNDK